MTASTSPGDGSHSAGRCSRYENVRRRERPGAEIANLAETRNKLIFAPLTPTPEEAPSRVGIPRALTAHSLCPLYSTFFSQLGLEVVLSGIDSSGWSRANSGFCFPVEIAHGAILDLVKAGTDTIFLPHVNRMPNPRADDVDSHLCPITQASPYFISNAFPGVAFLSPVLNFADGYDTCDGLVELASGQLGFPRTVAQKAYREAVRALDGSRAVPADTWPGGLDRSTERWEADGRPGRPQLQRVSCGGFPVRGKEALQPGDPCDSRRLSAARAHGPDLLALSQHHHECRGAGRTAPQLVPVVRE